MHAPSQRAVAAYARVGVETGVPAADPHQLVQMLFDGALTAIATGRLHMERGETGAKGAAVSKAIMIINDGLKASLDVESGGELARHLAALYDYMTTRLLDANAHDRVQGLGEVYALLSELSEAWHAIAGQARVAGVPSETVRKETRR